MSTANRATKPETPPGDGPTGGQPMHLDLELIEGETEDVIHDGKETFGE